MIDNFLNGPLPLRRATAESIKKTFRERIIASYGAPMVVLPDEGVQFACRIFKSFLTEMGIRQQFTTPCTTQDNPTERANRTVIIRLRHKNTIKATGTHRA